MGLPARKPVRSDGLESSYEAQKRFFKAFRAVTFELPSRVGYAAHVCACVILASQLGKSRPTGQLPPEWSTRLSQQDFAIAIHGAEECRKAADEGRDLSRGIRKALDEICYEASAKSANTALPFECRKSGKGYEFRVAPDADERIGRLPYRAPRTLPKKADRKPAPADAPPLPVALSCPLGQECPVDHVYEGVDGLTNIRETGTGVPVSSNGHTQVSSADSPREGGTPVPVSKPANGNGHRNSSSAIGELQLLDPFLASLIGKVPDELHWKRVAKALNGASVDGYINAVHRNQEKLKRYGTGFLLNIAEDCRKAHEKLAAGPGDLADLVRQLYNAPSDAAGRAIAGQILQHAACTPAHREEIRGIFPNLG